MISFYLQLNYFRE